MSKSLLSLAVTAFVLSGCSLIPDYQRPEAPVAAQFPQGPAYSSAQAPSQAAAEQGWKQFFHDPALQQLIQTALVNNRDLRTLKVDLAHFAPIRDVLPAETTVVAESGILGPADVRRLADEGADVILVGEALVIAGEPITTLGKFIESGAA